MQAPKSLLTAVVLTITITGPAMAAVGNGSAGNQVQKNHHGQGGHGGQSGENGGSGGGNSGGNSGGNGGNGGGNGGGEDLTHMRFAGMDTNHDGQISRSEWQGNDVSFNQHDWNGDGVLSGIEVTPGAQRPTDFTSMDRNHDNRISLSEWHGNRGFFNLLDADHNGFLSQAEFGQYGSLLAANRLQDLFQALDTNKDNRIGQSEWPTIFTTALFTSLDTNHDTFLSLDELRRIGTVLADDDDDDDDEDGQAGLQKTFNRMDSNHDNQISRTEWRGNNRNFNRLDANHNGFLTWTEFSTRGHQ